VSHEIDSTTNRDACPLRTGWVRDWPRLTFDTVKDTAFRRELPPGMSHVTWLTPLWTRGQGDPAAARAVRWATAGYTHKHCTILIAASVVHIDLLRASGHGPGWSLNAAFIHVDGTFRGRAWVFGCVGGGGNNFPAVAIVDADHAVSVEYEFGGYGDLPNVYGWSRHPAERWRV